MPHWYWIRRSPGELEPLDEADMVSFLRGLRAVDGGTEGTLCYVGLEVAIDRGTVMSAGRVWFARCPVHADGRLDQQAMLALAQEKLEVARRIVADEDRAPSPEDVLVDASAHFAARRLRHETTWQPDEADLLALRQSVNARAGWAVI